MNIQKKDLYRSSEKIFFDANRQKPVEEYVYIRDLGINVRVQLTGNGDPLLFIHGGPSAGTMWAELTGMLQEYRCLILDRPGCGLSEYLSYDNFTMNSLRDMITLIIDEILYHFNIKKVSIVSSSFGSYLTMMYTIKNSEKIKKLVIEGCPANVEKMSVPFFMKMMVKPGLKWLIPKLPVTRSVLLNIMKGLGHMHSLKKDKISREFINWYISLFNNTDTQKNDLEIISKIISGGTMVPEFILRDHEIEKIDVPVLFLWGIDDPFGRKEIGDRLGSITKNSSLIYFHNSGHLPWIDDPGIHAHEIKEFLKAAEKDPMVRSPERL